MRKFLIAAAGLTVVVAGSLTAFRAGAMPLALPAGMTNQLNMVEQVKVCFYFDGWNGPGLYECGYRYRRGFGWHGRRDDRRRDFRGDDRRRDFRGDDRRRDFRGDDRRRD
ncbi:MAG: hypothetical protein WAU53_02285 [Rhodoplanes sp.]